jgi:predicted ATPase/uncharacterized coiled-coil protein SlyX
MGTYTEYKHGSIWRRWDLHVHTPGTLKNDQFTGASIEERWANYINDINNYTDEISVIGITDYNSIDNYFKFQTHLLTGDITKSFDMVIPNVELRISPVTGSSTPINIHCLFNPDIDAEIQARFFSKLEFGHGVTSYSAERSELVRLGRAYRNDSSLEEEVARRVGASQFVVSFDALMKIFKSDPDLRKNTIILVSNSSNDGASGLQHSSYFVDGGSQLDTTRQAIYQHCDGIFSSNPSDINYFLGNGVDAKEEVIRKCGTLKPCFHGSDAHENAKLFQPDQSRYCWVKADPTFEGLKQTKYEPEARVKIQSLTPEIKSARHVISKISFTGGNELFGDQEIHLNDNLNAIIGGKSSGKSLLLYSIADSIDPAQVKRASEKLNFEGYNFEEDYDFCVEWKDGETDVLSDRDYDNKQRKITYIPQLYINYLAEKHNKDQLNDLVKSILLQDPDFKTFYEAKSNELDDLNDNINSLADLMVELRTKALNLGFQKKEIGTSASIKESIKKIEEQIQEGHKLSNFSDEEKESYDGLSKKKHELEELGRSYADEEKLISKILGEFSSKKRELLGSKNVLGEQIERGAIDRFIDEADYESQIAKQLKLIIEGDFEATKAKLNHAITQHDLSSKKTKNKNDLNELVEKLKPFEEKLKNQKDVVRLNQSLSTEKVKFNKVEGLDRQIKAFVEDYNKTKKRIVELLQERIDLYEAIVSHVNTFNNQIGADITLENRLEYRKVDFDFFHHVNKTAISADHTFHDFFNEEVVNYTRIPEFFSKIKRFGSENLEMEDGSNIRLNRKVDFKNVLDGFIKDAYHLDYIVTYKNDDLLNMSPGKKGTVLLILFLQISSNEYPILIDQPEDNLDNRTIYELLCQIIRDKKKNRQIIIVSHNANLVVSTDAENIIVANQEGQDPNRRKSEFQFEYVNGAIEYSFPMDTSIDGILFQQGIREHVCDILEGGNEAFKQRERKYALK